MSPWLNVQRRPSNTSQLVHVDRSTVRADNPTSSFDALPASMTSPAARNAFSPQRRLVPTQKSCGRERFKRGATMRVTAPVSLAALLLGTATVAFAQSAPIVMPAAPGQPSRVIDAGAATRLANTGYSPADVAFMQHMVVHHQQAVDMVALAKTRTNNPAILAMGGRIDASQADEMKFMRKWLSDRHEPLAMSDSEHARHTMKGMATEEQLARLAGARGTAFDRLLLELMVPHHQGALDMVQDLLRQQGSAYDPAMFQFTSDVTTDQKAEIDRMNIVLAGLSGDPRTTLSPGVGNAGEAISNLRRVTSLPKPAGFFDPANPAQLHPLKASKPGETPGKSKNLKKGEEPPKPALAERGA